MNKNSKRNWGIDFQIVFLVAMKQIIRIVSPAKAITKDLINSAIVLLEGHNFTVEVSENASGEHHYFSGTDEERLADFQAAIDDD